MKRKSLITEIATDVFVKNKVVMCLTILQLLLIIARLVGIVHFSYWLVFAPVLLAAAGIAIVAVAWIVFAIKIFK